MPATNYPYIISMMPELDFEEGAQLPASSPGVSLSEKESDQTSEAKLATLDALYDELRQELSPRASQALGWLHAPVDNRNFITLYCELDRPFLGGGNYTQEEFSRMIQNRELPDYLDRFLDLFDERRETEKLVANYLEDELATLFYEEAIRHPLPFLSRWFLFELDLSNLLTATQIRRFGIALEKRDAPRPGQSWAATLVGDRDANLAMMESKAYDFGLSGEFDWMDRILNIEKAPPGGLDLGVEKLRWVYAHELCRTLVGEEIFNLEYLLCYAIRFQIIRRRVSLTPSRGERQLERLQNDLVARATEMIFSETKEQREAG